MRFHATRTVNDTLKAQVTKWLLAARTSCGQMEFLRTTAEEPGSKGPSGTQGSNLTSICQASR